MAISLMELVYVPTFLVDSDGINVGKYLPVKWIVRVVHNHPVILLMAEIGLTTWDV